MDKYQITPAATGFQIVEVRPDGRDSRVYGFQTVADAEGWLDSFLLLLGLIDCLADEPTLH